MARVFRILAATDGSPSACAALAAAAAFPWPEPSRARAVVAFGAALPMRPALRAAARRVLDAETESAQRVLAQRWNDADAVASQKPPARAILAEAKRFGADVIVLGSRGYGTIQRLIAGSVSREVVARAEKPVLVARTAPKAVRRVVVGFDGSAQSLEAVRFLGRLAPPRGGRVVVVSVIQRLRLPPSASRMPASMRAMLRRETAEVNRARMRSAKQKADASVSKLKDAGWRATSNVQFGVSLDTLLAATAHHKADVLVVGARATSGITRALLGSVAAGVLNHSRIPVLVVP